MEKYLAGHIRSHPPFKPQCQILDLKAIILFFRYLFYGFLIKAVFQGFGIV